MALTLKWYFWMILWLMMMHHHTKFDRSEILSGQTFAEVHGATANSDGCGWVFFDELHVISFLWWISTLCFDSAVKGVAVAPALSAEWPRSFACYFSDTVVERTSKKESPEEAKSGGENFPAASGADRTRDLPITSQALYYWAIFKAQYSRAAQIRSIFS